MRVLVCGDRNWESSSLILGELAGLPGDSVIIHGGCSGADCLAGAIARNIGLRVEIFPAQWERHGRAAGPIRNKQMIVKGRPDKVLAFHNDIRKSKGTKDVVQKARAVGIPVKIITEDGEEAK